MSVSLKSCGTDTQHFFSFWRVIKLLTVASDKPQHSHSVLCCEENHGFHIATLTSLHFPSKWKNRTSSCKKAELHYHSDCTLKSVT